MYKDDIQTKAAFVQELSQLLKKFEIEDVGDLIYSNIDSDEKVTIFFRNGNYTEVNVHMDSLAAIVRDVMKALQ